MSLSLAGGGLPLPSTPKLLELASLVALFGLVAVFQLYPKSVLMIPAFIRDALPILFYRSRLLDVWVKQLDRSAFITNDEPDRVNFNVLRDGQVTLDRESAIYECDHLLRHQGGYVLISGAPGSGKSTFAMQVAQQNYLMLGYGGAFSVFVNDSFLEDPRDMPAAPVALARVQLQHRLLATNRLLIFTVKINFVSIVDGVSEWISGCRADFGVRRTDLSRAFRCS